MRIEDNIANEFNIFSVNYTNDMIRCVPHYLKLTSAFTDGLTKGFAPRNILDLGCGNGNVTSQLLQLFPESNYTLLDASPEMINLCKNLFKGYSIEYITSYFKGYTFKEDYYDLITAGFSLHHCNSEEKKTLFQSIYRSLKKEGLFGCSDLMMNKNRPEHSKLLKQWKDFVARSFPDDEKWKWLMEHYEEFDKPDDYVDQLKWLEQAGFKNVTLTTHDSYWAHIRAIKE